MESSHSHEHQQVEDNHILVVDSSYCGLPWNETGIDTSLRDVKQQSIHHHNMDLSGFSTENFGVYELQELARIKNELSVTGSCLDLHEIISFRPTFNNEDVINQDMLLKTLLKSDQFVNLIPSSAEPIFNASFVLPTLKVSHLNDQSTNFFDVKLPALHPFGYPTFNGSLNYEQSCPLSYNNGDQMKSRIEKRPAKANPAKKSKLELRPSCTPMKVRKEKLGDRILALQQMVAPFGKTDTASVLMEAIGYIKFLQNQVETLSMPYMNSTNCSSKISKEGGLTEDENEEAKRNLRSRGLCLLPLSCLTYVTYGGEQCLLGNNNNAASEHYF